MECESTERQAQAIVESYRMNPPSHSVIQAITLAQHQHVGNGPQSVPQMAPTFTLGFLLPLELALSEVSHR